jgi:hypothetical protein
VGQGRERRARCVTVLDPAGDGAVRHEQSVRCTVQTRVG